MRTIIYITLGGFVALSLHVVVGHAWIALDGMEAIHGHSHHDEPAHHDQDDHGHQAHSVVCKSCPSAVQMAAVGTASAPTLFVSVTRRGGAPALAEFLSGRDLYLRKQTLLV